MKIKWILKTSFLQGTKDKIYDVLATRILGKTKKQTWYKIIDDSGESYWYPEECFIVIKQV